MARYRRLHEQATFEAVRFTPDMPGVEKITGTHHESGEETISYKLDGMWVGDGDWVLTDEAGKRSIVGSTILQMYYHPTGD